MFQVFIRAHFLQRKQEKNCEENVKNIFKIKCNNFWNNFLWGEWYDQNHISQWDVLFHDNDIYDNVFFVFCFVFKNKNK